MVLDILPIFVAYSVGLEEEKFPLITIEVPDQTTCFKARVRGCRRNFLFGDP